jgi:DNA topoisomerase-1
LLVLSFNGKGGQPRRIELQDVRLARLAARFRAIPGRAFLKYEREGKFQPLTSQDVNDYLRSIAGSSVTAKAFRTWRGSAIVAERLFRAPPARSQTARRRQLAQALRDAAESLGNTPTICRKYYVHPQIVEDYLAGRFADIVAGFSPRASRRFTPGEQVLLHFLTAAIKSDAGKG